MFKIDNNILSDRLNCIPDNYYNDNNCIYYRK